MQKGNFRAGVCGSGHDLIYSMRYAIGTYLFYACVKGVSFIKKLIIRILLWTEIKGMLQDTWILWLTIVFVCVQYMCFIERLNKNISTRARSTGCCKMSELGSRGIMGTFRIVPQNSVLCSAG